MVTAAPNLTYGTVIGKFILTTLDGPDADRYSDYLPAVGTVTFRPATTYYKNLSIPATVVTTTVTATIDSNGDIRDSQGALGVVLVATDNPDLSPNNWTYTVNVSASGVSFSFPIKVLGGTTQDITIISPISSSPGVEVIVTSQDRILAQQAAAAAAQSAAEAAASAGSGGGGGLTAGAVMDIHVNANANIVLSKTVDSSAGAGRLAMTTAERTKLGGIAAGATSWSTEQIQDLVASLLVEGVGIDIAYDDTANTLTITNTGVAVSPSADPGNAISVSPNDGKMFVDGDQWAPPGNYALITDLKYVGRLWVLEAVEDATDVPSDFPASSGTSFSVVLRKLT